MKANGIVGISAFVAAVLLAGMSCSDSRSATPAGPTAVTAGTAALSTSAPRLYSSLAVFDSRSGPMVVTFPPRNEPFDFKLQLEAKYRGMGRSTGTTYVDPEGDIVWTSEYLLYRLNLCSHPDAVAKVMRQIDSGGAPQPLCGNAPSGTVAFPPRNEPFDFRNQLEAKYRDGLRTAPSSTYVDLEGDVVWITEYTRYRVNECTHADAVQKVLQQIDGAPAQPVCTRVEPVIIRAVINGPSGTVNVGIGAQFSGLNSSSNKGPIVSYQWKCSDTQTANCSSGDATPQFKYSKTGPVGTTVNHNVTLTVRDSAGNSATANFTLRVSQNY
jgi:PKD domain